MKFGNIDKTDFLIPPFALLYFYVLFAAAFDLPNFSTGQFFHSEPVAWAGVLFCLASLILLLWSLISFRRSFRIGIDWEQMLVLGSLFQVTGVLTNLAIAFAGRQHRPTDCPLSHLGSYPELLRERSPDGPPL